MSIRLGIGSWTFPWAIGVPGYKQPEKPLSIFELLERAKAMEVDVVQICDNIPLHKISVKELEEIRKKADENRLTIEIGTRGVETNHLLQYLKIANVLQAKLVRTILDTPCSWEGIETAKKYLGEVLPKYEDAGVAIAIENHDRHTTNQLVEMIKDLNSRYIGICLDTVNSFGALEAPDHVVNALAPYTICLHIKDFIIKRVDHNMGFIITGCPAGEGKLDIGRIFKLLGSQSKDFSIILEQWPIYLGDIEDTIKNEYDWAQKSIKFLKGKMQVFEE